MNMRHTRIDGGDGLRIELRHYLCLGILVITGGILRLYHIHLPVAGLPVLVHLRRDFLACDKALRAQIAQPAVRSFRVVMLSPILNDDAGFA